ncbi:PH domain-containing protein [Candidatus Daviesbacteria bacterium]|nr:PH domain-containing protein [Candidatus Daviesbacteria bacterium]
MFPSYVVHPQNCRFEGQDPNEKILLLLRAHPITNFIWIIPVVSLIIFPFFIPPVLTLLNFNISQFPVEYRLIFLIINYLLAAVIAFEGFLHWYFNVFIVTDKNIIDIDFHSLLFKNIDVAPLRNVEDTSSSMGGLLQSIFNYGNVFIQTAGASRNIDFHSVPRPHHVADFILDEVHKLYGS